MESIVGQMMKRKRQKFCDAKKVCDDGIHCGTDDEDDKRAKKVCGDGIHCGTDDEDNKKAKKVCDDGIHCGTDDEEDKKAKKVCDDGIHCGTENEDDKKAKKVCDDGIHCGTDDENDEKAKKVCDDEDDKKAKKVCDDGIHCGTDDEDDKKAKKVCDDGIHCGTDDEDDKKAKKVCDDGIHCGTDDEDDKKAKKVCDDGIHCGTDDEEDKKAKKVCDDGIHCGTDDEEDKKAKKVCDDGIHCGTDDEKEETSKGANNIAIDGKESGEDCETSVENKKKMCEDGIHCGTDDEEDSKTQSQVTGESLQNLNDQNFKKDSTTCASDKTVQEAFQVLTSSNGTDASYNATPPATSHYDEQIPQLFPGADLTESNQNSSVPKTSEKENNSTGVTESVAKSLMIPQSSSSTSNSNTENAGLPLSIHHNISSQLAAVSKSLANFNPQVGDSAEAHAVSPVRPSQSLSELNFPVPLSSQSSVAPAITPATSVLTTASSTLTTTTKPVSELEGSVNSAPQESQKSQGPSDPSCVKATSHPQAEAKNKQDIVKEDKTSTDLPKSIPRQLSTSPKPTAASAQQTYKAFPDFQESKEEVSLVNIMSSAAAPVTKAPDLHEKLLSPVTTKGVSLSDSSTSIHSVIKTSSNSSTSVTTVTQSSLPPSIVTSEPTSVVSATPGAIVTKVTSSFQTPPLTTAPGAISSTLRTSSFDSQTMQPRSSPTILTQQAIAKNTQMSQPQQAPRLPVPVASTTTQSCPPSNATTSSASGNIHNVSSSSSLTPSPSTSFSTARSGTPSETRIPPLRIRMDGSSQPQVYESSTPSSREYVRTSSSDFSTPPPRSKAEGDLKLVLRKSSDGTAELISGPSFREKKSRQSSSSSSSSSSSFSTTTAASPMETSAPTTGSGFSKQDSDLSSSTGSRSGQLLQQAPSQPQLSVPMSQSTSSSGQKNFNTMTSLPLAPSSSSLPSQNIRTLDLNTPSSTSASTSHISKVSVYSATGGPYSSGTSSPSISALSSSEEKISKERTEPFCPGSNQYKNVTYTKSADTDVVKINVNSSRTTGEGTKKVRIKIYL